MHNIFQLYNMDLKQPLSDIFQLDADNFITCTGTSYKTIIKKNAILPYAQSLQLFHKIVNALGQLSATSQGLKQVITNVIRFSGTNQRIYIKVMGTQAVGFVKTGQKNLFYRDIAGAIKQLQPTCVLDIYVHESCQRTGYGKEIFQKFLKQESITPQRLAYDRPSIKLISFLKKHYQLSQYIPQNNNYVIFNKFFTNGTAHYNQGQKFQNLNSQYTNRQRPNSNLSNIKYKQKQNKEKPYMANYQRAVPHFQSNTSIKDKGQTNQKIMDSLEMFTKEVEKNKTKTLPSNTSKQIEGLHQQMQKRNVVNYHVKNTQNIVSSQVIPPSKQQLLEAQNSAKSSLQNNGRFSLNMKIQDLAYRVPWALQNQQVKNNFRTTSNAYGSYYKY